MYTITNPHPFVDTPLKSAHTLTDLISQILGDSYLTTRSPNGNGSEVRSLMRMHYICHVILTNHGNLVLD